jgi:hypothetical protein
MDEKDLNRVKQELRLWVNYQLKHIR